MKQSKSKRVKKEEETAVFFYSSDDDDVKGVASANKSKINKNRM
jgi:hypothetical protein